jgi:hypothetical protein
VCVCVGGGGEDEQKKGTGRNKQAGSRSGEALRVDTAVGAPGRGDTASSDRARLGRRMASAERGPLQGGARHTHMHMSGICRIKQAGMLGKCQGWQMSWGRQGEHCQPVNC